METVAPEKPETESSAKNAPTSGVLPDEHTPASPLPAPDPTRYGDWEINGKCIDF